MGTTGEQHAMGRLLYQVAVAALAAHLLIRLPLPSIPGAYVSLKNVLVVLVCVIYLGKVLYDTLYQPRGPWGTRP